MKKIAIAILCVFFSLLVDAQSIAFSENFESNTLPDSLTSSSNTANSWASSTNLKHSGTFSDSCRVAVGDTSKLTSYAFSMSGYSHAILSFWHICKIEYTDKAFIDVSIDNGATWISLTSVQYFGSGQFGVLGNYFNSASYPTDWQVSSPYAAPTNNWWKQEFFDISSIVGNSNQVKIRFRLVDGAPFNGSAGNAGWFVDDILINKAMHEIVPPSISMNTNYTDTIFNTGPFAVNATIVDASGILKAGIAYKINNSLTFDTILMSKTTGNNYEGFIPSKTYNNKIFYSVFAIDSLVNTSNSVTDTFFIKESSSVITIGTGTVTNLQTAYPSPFGNYYWGTREQYIIPAAELQAAGMTKRISALAFDVASLNGCAPLHDFTVKLGMTSSTILSNNFVIGNSQVYYNSLYTPIVGWNNFVFTTPFAWDGISSIVVETCFYNPSGTKNASVNQTLTPYISTVDNQVVTPVCSAATGNTFLQRPNIRFTNVPDTCNFDAGVLEIISPNSAVQLANTNIPLKLTIKSYGNVDLTKVAINYSIDGVIKTPLVFTGILQKAMVSSMILVDSFMVTAGQHLLKTWTSLPNDSLDQNNSNDTISKSIFACNNILNGTYTIGGNGSDFQNFSSALSSLQSCGISGPVTFNIAPGIYYESIDISSIPGTSSINTISFKSANNDSTAVIIKNAIGINYILKITNSDNLIFQGITFDGSILTSGNSPINITSSKNIKFKSCTIKAIPNSTNTQDFGINANFGFSYLTIENCLITGGYCGVNCVTSTGVKASKTSIINSRIEDFYYNAAFLNSNDSIVFFGNYILNRINAQYGSLLQINNSNGQAIISNNKMYARSTSSCTAININGLNTDVSQKSLIANNFIACTNGGFGNNGLYLNNVTNMEVLNNSVNITSGNTTSRCVFIGASLGMTFLNNCISNTAAGYAIYVTNPGFDAINYNNYYSTGIMGYYNTAASNLAAWKALCLKDTSSISINPFYASATDLHTSEFGLYKKGVFMANAAADIDNDARSSSKVCIGADEFYIPPFDAGLLSIIKPSSLENEGEIIPVKVLLKNCGSDTIFASSIKYKMDNGSTTNFSYLGTLAPGNSDTVLLPNLLIPAGNHFFKVWTELPNDTKHANDTLSKAFYGKPLHDLKMVKIYRPFANDTANITRALSVQVKNEGNLTIYSGSIYYKINQSATIAYTISDSIQPNETKNYILQNLLIPKDTNLITVFCSTPNDGDKTNDTLRLKFYGQSNFDGGVKIVYSLSKMPKKSGAPYFIKAVVQNNGYQALSNFKYYLNISGANAFTDSVSVNLAVGQQETIAFAGFAPTNIGGCTVSVSAQFDSILTNNSIITNLTVTDTIYSYANGNVATNYMGFASASGMVLTKYKINGAKAVHTISAFINGITTLGQSIYAVVLDSNGIKICQSSNKIISASDTAKWVDFVVYDSSKVFFEENIYVGLALVQGLVDYFPVGVQFENPVRPETFYYKTGLTGTGKPNDAASLNLGKFMINALLTTPPPYCVGAIEISKPMGGCGQGFEVVKMKIKNEGTEVISSGLSLSYKELSASGAITENVSASIQPGSIYEYTFNTPLNLTTAVNDTFFVKGWVNYNADPFKNNDTTLFKLIPSYLVPGNPTVVNKIIQYATADTLKALAANPSDSLYWFSNSYGGNSIKRGNNFVTPILYDTAIYYVEAGGKSTDTMQVGMGNITNTATSYPAPYGNFAFGAKHQLLILASELTAQNITAGPINSIAFNVSSVNSCPTLIANEIKIKNTSISALTSQWETGLISVWNAPTFSPNVGWNVHSFSTPFIWDGVSNLVIEYCFNNNGKNATGNASFYQTSTSFSSTHYYYADASTICSSPLSGTVINQRPNLKFSNEKSNAGACTSARIPVKAFVNNIPANDCGIDSILSPLSNPPSFVNQTISVKLKNFGTANLTSATLNYSIDGLVQTPIIWTGILAKGATVTVNIGTNQFNVGNHQIKAWAVGANGQPNAYPINDTVSKSVFSCIANGPFLISKTNPNAQFTSFSEAVIALVNCGINSPIAIKVDTGIYNEQITIPQILGTSSVNTITFESLGDSSKTILKFNSTSSTNNFVLKLDGADYIRFKNITFKNTGISYATVIQIGNGSNYNVFANNIINSYQGSTTGNYCIYSPNGMDEYNLFNNNSLNFGYQSIYWQGMSSSQKEKGNTFSLNTLSDFNTTGTYFSYQDSMNIKGNSISSDPTGFQGTGIYLNYVDYSSVLANKIIGNSVNSHIGINLGVCKGSSSKPFILANNFVAIQGGSGMNIGIYCVNSDSINFYFNSISTNAGTQASRSLNQSGGTNLRFLNNIFANYTQGYAVYFNSANSIAVNDYNDYYTNGLILGYWNGDRSNLTDFKIATSKDQNSISTDPLFVSSTNLHCMSPLVNAKAKPNTGIDVDIDGELRNYSKPDIGADEFNAPAIDLATISLISPVATGCFSSTTKVKVRIQNMGTDTIFFASQASTINVLVSGNFPYSFPSTIVNSGLLAPLAYRDVEISSNYNMSNAGNYTFKIYTTIAGDGNNLNDTLQNVSIQVAPTVSSFPFSENFESFTVGTPGSIYNNWSREGYNSYTWNVNAGPTPSLNTGPSTDHTFGSNFGKYMFTESNFGGLNNQANLISPCLDLKSMTNPTVEFWYHMLGDDCKALYVYGLDTNGNWVVADSLIGPDPSQTLETSPWVKKVVNLSNFTHDLTRIRFSAIRGISYDGDIAIDDITVNQRNKYDIVLKNILEPSKPFAITNELQSVKIQVQNYGWDTIHAISVGYIYNGILSGSAIIPITILPDSSFIYTFTNTFSVVAGPNQLATFVKTANDIQTKNDTMKVNFQGLNIITPDFVDNFEAANYFSPGSFSSLWSRGTTSSATINAAHSPSKLWKTNLNGNYIDGMEDYLYSPYFDFSQVYNGATLNFWHWVDVQTNNDACQLQYSTDGIYWASLGYVGDTAATNWYNANLNGANVWSANSTGWKQSSYNLTQFNQLANPVQFRFKFISDGTISNFDGWGIDDFKIELNRIPYDAGVYSIINPTISTPIGSTVQVKVAIKNYGLLKLDTIPIIYKTNALAQVVDTLFISTPGLLPNAVDTFAFSTPYLAPFADYDLCAWTNVASDVFHNNDTTCKSIIATSPLVDISVNQIISPNIQTKSSHVDSVKIMLINKGINPISLIPVEYKINALIKSSDTIHITLNYGDTAYYTFKNPFTGMIGSYNLCAYSKVPGDANATNDMVCKSLIGINDVGIFESINDGFAVGQNIPNPANNTTKISYELPFDGEVIFTLINTLGQKVYSIVEEGKIGKNEFNLNVVNFQSGVYYYSVEFNKQRIIKKLIVNTQN